MPLTYRIDRVSKIVFSTAEGAITYQDVLDHEEHIHHDPDFEPEFSQLVDCRQVTEAKLTADFMRSVALVNIFSPKARRAFVTKGNFVYGLLRMYQILKADAHIAVFRDMDEARHWLGMD